MRWAFATVLAGCGRLAFDPLATDSSVSDTASSDGEVVPFACPTLPVPDTVTISGKTFRYTNFTNGMAAVDATTVNAISLGSGVSQGSATSNASGLYTISFAIGGTPRPIYLTYFRATYLPTYAFLDAPLGGDLIAAQGGQWIPGDGPLWQSAQMDMIYMASGVPRMTNAGAINVGVRDCDDVPIEGVEVLFDPAPGALRYQDDAGMPSQTLSSTGAVFGHVLALNPQQAVTRITARKEGYRFTEVSISITTGSNNLVLIHGGI